MQVRDWPATVRRGRDARSAAVGDIDGDGHVGLPDVTWLAMDFFGSYHFRSDLQRDGVINLSDLGRLAALHLNDTAVEKGSRRDRHAEIGRGKLGTPFFRTLHRARRFADLPGILETPGGPEGWSTADKFAAVVETAALNDAELSAYCRKRGLYPEQVQAWRTACEQANDWAGERARRSQAEQGELRRQVHALQRDLTHKEKALAETAALLVLSKKAAAIWGDEDA